MNHNKKYGQLGEGIAKNYLIRSGYTIIHQNYRVSRDEIDIIAKKEELIACIEVKTRLSDRCGKAESQFSHNKITSLKRSALMYCHLNNINEEQISIQGIAVNLSVSNKIANISHFISLIS